MPPPDFNASATLLPTRVGRREMLASLLLGAVPLSWAQQPVSRRLTVGIEAALHLSGLGARLGQALARDTGLAIDWRPGPGGLLLAQLERGELDAAIACQPELEEALQRQGLVHDRRPVARGELLLVGPAPRPATRQRAAAGDPAGIAGLKDAAEALRRIAAAGQRDEAAFVTPREPSGERAIEQMLWKAAGPQPLGPWLRTAGTGPAAVLSLAKETGAYALVERGVWLAQGGGALASLVVGDPRLVAHYHVMRSFRVQHPGGKLMVNWLAGRNGRRVVGGFGRGYLPPA